MKYPGRLFSLYPILCNYYITTRCNAKCVFCNIWESKGINAADEDVQNNLKDLVRLGVRFIDFTGGEPLMHPGLPEILGLAQKSGFQTTVTTNCILYPQMAEQLRGKINLLHFSLDAPNREEHDQIRGVKCFDKVMQSLEIAKSLGEVPDLLFTVTEENLHHLPEMIRFAQDRKLILLTNPVFSYFQNSSSSQHVLKTLLDVAKEPYVYVNRGIIRFMLKGGNQTVRPRCKAFTTTLVISPDNRLLLPCYHQTQQSYPIENNLYPLVKSPKMQRWKKKEGRLNICQNCTISCYFDPSFTYGVDDYFLLSQLSKVKYSIDKYFRRNLKFE